MVHCCLEKLRVRTISLLCSFSWLHWLLSNKRAKNLFVGTAKFIGSYTLLVRLACLHSRKTEDASATHLECCDKRARSKSFSLSGMLYSPYRVNGKKRSSCQSRKGSQFSREEGILVRAAHS